MGRRPGQHDTRGGLADTLLEQRKSGRERRRPSPVPLWTKSSERLVEVLHGLWPLPQRRVSRSPSVRGPEGRSKRYRSIEVLDRLVVRFPVEEDPASTRRGGGIGRVEQKGTVEVENRLFVLSSLGIDHCSVGIVGGLFGEDFEELAEIQKRKPPAHVHPQARYHTDPQGKSKRRNVSDEISSFSVLPVTGLLACV